MMFDRNHDKSGGGSDEGDCREDGTGIGQVLENIEGEQMSDPDLYSILHPARYSRFLDPRIVMDPPWISMIREVSYFVTESFLDQWKEMPEVYIHSNQYNLSELAKHALLFDHIPLTGSKLLPCIGLVMYISMQHAFRGNKWYLNKEFGW